MAKKSMVLKSQAPAKFSSRKYTRCSLCGRCSTEFPRKVVAK